MTTRYNTDALLRGWHASGYAPEQAEALKKHLDERFAPPPDNTCHWCGKSDTENEDDGYGPCVDITVITANGEEGFAQVTRYACFEHLEEIAEALIALGFGQHRHGGSNFLEPRSCPGYNTMRACPTPEVED